MEPLGSKLIEVNEALAKVSFHNASPVDSIEEIERNLNDFMEKKALFDNAFSELQEVVHLMNNFLEKASQEAERAVQQFKKGSLRKTVDRQGTRNLDEIGYILNQIFRLIE